MKIYPYISENEKNEYLNNMENYTINIGKESKNYLIYLNILKILVK